MSTNPTPFWAHTEGLASVAFSKDGSEIYTAGNDAVLRHWPQASAEVELTDSSVIDGHPEEAITCIDRAGDYLVTACEDGVIRVFSTEKNELNSSITRFNLAARCVAVESIEGKATRIAAGSE